MDSDSAPIYNETDDADSPDDMHKTSPYVRTIVGLHNLRDRAKEAVDALHEKGIQERIQDGWNQAQTEVKNKTRSICSHPDDVTLAHIPKKYGYVFRPKSYWELVLLGGTVCGIEFCYSAETAFVTPILLSLGLNIKFVTMIWCLSPLIGLFLTPLLGSMSDSCSSGMGRRRPFILLYSIGIIAGLILVPNGHLIGLALGDTENTLGAHNIHLYNTANETLRNSNEPQRVSQLNSKQTVFHNSSYPIEKVSNNTSGSEKKDFFEDHSSVDLKSSDSSDTLQTSRRHVSQQDYTLTIENHNNSSAIETSHVQSWSIAFTVIGTILLDFCSDACQSPSRTYMLDVSIPDDHAAGLSTFTSMAGLGGSLGYIMGAIHWDQTFLGKLLGSQETVVFTSVSVIFVICLIVTLTSFPEIPLSVLRNPVMFQEYQDKLQNESWKTGTSEMVAMEGNISSYGATEQNNGFEEEPEKAVVKEEEVPPIPQKVIAENGKVPEIDVAAELTTENQHPTLLDFLKSIIHMPGSLKVLCLTNLFCWMSLVCYSLYFTDFVAECVFGGDPTAPIGTIEHDLYENGVRFACWGMALYSFSCAVYSHFIELLVKKIGARPVYIGGQLVYSVGMVAMALSRNKIAVILLSPTAGIMYATLFTMPYLLIAHYHSLNKFSAKGGNNSVRGIGTDVAAVSSMVFLSQLILSVSMGTIVEAVNSNVATVCAAAIISACGAVSASQVTYLDI